MSLALISLGVGLTHRLILLLGIDLVVGTAESPFFAAVALINQLISLSSF